MGMNYPLHPHAIDTLREKSSRPKARSLRPLRVGYWVQKILGVTPLENTLGDVSYTTLIHHTERLRDGYMILCRKHIKYEQLNMIASHGEIGKLIGWTAEQELHTMRNILSSIARSSTHQRAIKLAQEGCVHIENCFENKNFTEVQ